MPTGRATRRYGLSAVNQLQHALQAAQRALSYLDTNRIDLHAGAGFRLDYVVLHCG